MSDQQQQQQQQQQQPASPAYLNHWVERWDTGRTGWHRQDYNPSLLAHADAVIADPNSNQLQLQQQQRKRKRVFIPLCGKTRDIFFWIEKGFEVVANEFTAKAFAEFSAENHESVQWEPTPQFENSQIKVFRASNLPLTWVQGDYFALTPDLVVDVGQFDVIYDRASMIAVNPDQRSHYAKIEYSLLRMGGKMLLVVANYNLDGMQGPPHSIPEQVLREQVFPQQEYSQLQIEKLGSIDSSGQPPFNKPTIQYAFDDTYLISRQSE